jgi:biopolymer transport protein ExbD
VGLKLTSDEDGINDINITPFVDIILVVLIIFMVTATYIVDPSIKVSLPEAATGEAGEDSSLGITLTSEGEMYLNGETVSEERLREVIRREKARDKDVVCLIAADHEVSHGEVVRIIDVVRQEGVARFALNIQPSESPTSPPTETPGG